MTVPLSEALASFSRTDRLIAAAALEHIANKPGPSERARSVAAIIEVLAAFVRYSVEAAP